jgi:hypothetical protein
VSRPLGVRVFWDVASLSVCVFWDVAVSLHCVSVSSGLSLCRRVGGADVSKERGAFIFTVKESCILTR